MMKHLYQCLGQKVIEVGKERSQFSLDFMKTGNTSLFLLAIELCYKARSARCYVVPFESVMLCILKPKFVFTTRHARSLF